MKKKNKWKCLQCGEEWEAVVPSPCPKCRHNRVKHVKEEKPKQEKSKQGKEK